MTCRQYLLSLLRRVAICALLVPFYSVGVASMAAGPNNFFAGKTIRLFVGFPPGGYYDLYARVIAQFWPNHIPGHPAMVVTSMPGAASLTMLNYIYNVAPKDGTEIGTPATFAPFEAVFKGKGVHFDPTKLSWIGSANKGSSTCLVLSSAKAKSVADLMSIPTTFGATGPGAPPFVEPSVLNRVLGTKIKIVVGYTGVDEILLAMTRGELDGACGFGFPGLVATHGDLIKSGKLRFLVQDAAERNPGLPDVPLMTDIAQNDRQRQLFQLLAAPQRMDKVYIAPPGTAPDRLALLRHAFDETMRDPEFLKKAQEAQLDVQPSTGSEVEQIFSGIAKMDPSIIEDMIKARGDEG